MGGDSDPDSYAAPKRALRDAIKWLIATFGALTAWTVGGVAVSSLGALPLDGPRFWIGFVALLVALGLILLALAKTVALLQPELLYRADLRTPETTVRGSDPALDDVRSHITAHSVQLLPWEYRNSSVNKVLDETDRLERLVADDQAPAAERTGATAKLTQLGPYFTRLQSLGSYLWLYHRFNRTLPRLGLFSVGALFALTAFSVAVKSPESAGGATTVVVEEGCNHRCPAAGHPGGSAGPAFASVRFELGKADVLSDQLGAVSAVRDWLRGNADTAVLLRAHTDTVAGTNINTALAHQRADAVRKLLTEVGGIERDRIFIAELPQHALPVITMPETGQVNNRVVDFIAVRLPPRR